MTTLTERALSHQLLDESQQDTTHALAQLLYERGDFTQALDVFRLLALCAPMRARSWFSVAACHEAIDDEEHAAKLYELAVHVGGDSEFAVLAAIRGANLLCNLRENDRASALLDALPDDIGPSLDRQVEALRNRLVVRRAS